MGDGIHIMIYDCIIFERVNHICICRVHMRNGCKWEAKGSETKVHVSNVCRAESCIQERAAAHSVRRAKHSPAMDAGWDPRVEWKDL